MTNTIRFDGTDVSLEAETTETLLDEVERNGYSIPYSCRKGVCSACLGTLVAGTVIDRSTRIDGPSDDVYFCQAKAATDVIIKPSRWSEYDPASRKTLAAKIKKITWITPDVAQVVLRFPVGVRAIFRAGQYLRVSFDGVERSYSLANPPHKNTEAVLHVRKYASGMFSDHFLSRAEPGNVVQVELPFGDVALDLEASEPLMMLATGTGFAPVKSIVESLVHLQVVRPVHLFWGGRDESDLYMRDIVREWESRFSWFRFTPVVSRPAVDWTGEVGWVQNVAVLDYPEMSESTVFACGNHDMVSGARDVFENAGVQRFYSDSFVPATVLGQDVRV